MTAQVIGEAAIDIRATSTKFQSDINNLLKGLGNKSGAGITPQINQDGLRSQLNQAQGQISNFTENAKQSVNRGFATLGAAAGGFIATALYKGFARITTIQDATASLTVALGDAGKAAKVLDDVLGVVRGTPFNLDQFAQAASQMISFGVEAQKIPTYLTAIGEAAATRGSQANEYAQRLSIVFGQVSAIGRITTDSLYSLNNVGVNALQILGNSFNKTTAQIREMVSAGLIPAKEGLDILSKGILNGSDGINGRTLALAGTMAKLRLTLTGAIGGFSAATARFGAALIDPLKDGLTALFTAGSSTLDNLSARFKSVIAGLANSPAAQSFIAWIRDIPNNIGPAIDKLLEFKSVIAPIAAALGALSLNSLGGVLGPLGALLPSISPIAAILATLVATTPELSKSFVEIGKSLQDLIPAFIEIGKSVAQLAASLVQILIPAVQVFVAVLKPVVNLLAANIGIVKALAIGLGALLVISKVSAAFNQFKLGLSGAATSAAANTAETLKAGMASEQASNKFLRLGAAARSARDGLSSMAMGARESAAATAAAAASSEAAASAAGGGSAGADAGDAASKFDKAKLAAGGLAIVLGAVSSQTKGLTSDITGVGAAAAAGFAAGGPWGAAIGAGVGLLTTLLGNAEAKAAELKKTAEDTAAAWKEAFTNQVNILTRNLDPSAAGDKSVQIARDNITYLKELTDAAVKANNALETVNNAGGGTARTYAGGGETVNINKFGPDLAAQYNKMKADVANFPDLPPLTLTATTDFNKVDDELDKFHNYLVDKQDQNNRDLLRKAATIDPSILTGVDLSKLSSDKLQAKVDGLIAQNRQDLADVLKPFTDANISGRGELAKLLEGIYSQPITDAGVKASRAKLAAFLKESVPVDVAASLTPNKAKAPEGIAAPAGGIGEALGSAARFDTQFVKTRALADAAFAAQVKQFTGLDIVAATTADDIAKAYASIPPAVLAAATDPSWDTLKQAITGTLNAIDELKKSSATSSTGLISNATIAGLQGELALTEKIAKASQLKRGDTAGVTGAFIDFKKSVEDNVFADAKRIAANDPSLTQDQALARAAENAKRLTREFLANATAATGNAKAVQALAIQLGLTPKTVAIDIQLKGIEDAKTKLTEAQTTFLAGRNVGDLGAADLATYSDYNRQIRELNRSAADIQATFDEADGAVVNFGNSSGWGAIKNRFSELLGYVDTAAKFKTALEGTDLFQVQNVKNDALQGQLAIQEKLLAVGELKKGQDGDLFNSAVSLRTAILDQVSANIAAGDSMATASKKAQDQAQAFLASAAAAGYNKDYVEKLAGSLGLLPSQVKIQIELAGIAEAIAGLTALQATFAAGQAKSVGLAEASAIEKRKTDYQAEYEAAYNASIASFTPLATFTPTGNASKGGGGKAKKAPGPGADPNKNIDETISNAIETLKNAILDISKTITDYADKLRGDIKERTKFDKAVSIQRLIGNTTQRTSQIKEFSTGLTSLRNVGLSEDAISKLNLTGPESVKQIRKLLKATPDQIQQLNAALVDQKQTALNEAAIAEGKVIADAITEALGKFFNSTQLKDKNGKIIDAGITDPALIGQLTLQVQNNVADPQALALAIANAVASKLKR